MSAHAKRGMYVSIESINVGDYIRVFKEPCEVVAVEWLEESRTKITYMVTNRRVSKEFQHGLTMFTYRRKGK